MAQTKMATVMSMPLQAETIAMMATHLSILEPVRSLMMGWIKTVTVPMQRTPIKMISPVMANTHLWFHLASSL